MSKLFEKNHFILVFGLALCVLPFVMQVQNDFQTRENKTIIFTDSFGNKIFNKYYLGEKNVGVMLYHGMGEDQNSLNLYVSKFQKLGYHVFSTDFSGHGRSSGLIPSGNNSDIILAEDVLTAKAFFKNNSGLKDSEIFLLGHSMGARAIMKACTLDSNPVNGCILLGASLQALNENDTSDWVNKLDAENPAVNILILTGTWEDVFPPIEAYSLYLKLANETTISKDPKSTYCNTSINLRKEIKIFRCLTHTHEAMSLRCTRYVGFWIESILNNYYPKDSFIPDWMNISHFQDYRIWLLNLEIIGMIIALIYGTEIIKESQVNLKNQIKNNRVISDVKTEDKNNLNNKDTSNLKIVNIKKFLLFKILILIGGLGFGAIIGLIFIFLPVSKPFFTLVFLCPIAGYGFVHLLLYAIKKIPGTKGKWKIDFKSLKNNLSWQIILFGAITSILIIAITSYALNSFFNHIFPLNIRLLFLTIFTLLAIPGFYFQQFELQIIRESYPIKKEYLIYNNLIFLSPFILGSMYILATGAIIFFIDAIHDLIILAIIILMGNLLQAIWKKPILTAIIQTFLLFFLVLPRGPLMVFLN